MSELLDRAELPLSRVAEENNAISAIVPRRIGISALEPAAKIGSLVLAEAHKTVSDWYNEDMDFYKESLDNQELFMSRFRGYEEFNPSWRLGARTDGSGFLRLEWQAAEGWYFLSFNPVPTLFVNHRGEDGHFELPGDFKSKGKFPIQKRSSGEPVRILMAPERLRKYAGIIEDDSETQSEEQDQVDAIGFSFDSSYVGNLAKAILLRNFGVYYLNQLEKLVPEKTPSNQE